MAWDRASEHGRGSPTIQQCEREREKERTIGSVVIMWHSASPTTLTARRRSFIKLKFIRNVCSSWWTLREQVTHNPRVYCICLLKVKWLQLGYSPTFVSKVEKLTVTLSIGGLLTLWYLLRKRRGHHWKLGCLTQTLQGQGQGSRGSTCFANKEPSLSTAEEF